MISFVRSEAPSVPVRFLCRHFGVNRSSYYCWESSQGQTKSEKKKQSVCKAIISSFDESHGTYGSPRMTEELRSQGIEISENTVAKYMHELGLDARLKKRFRVQTTDSSHSEPIAERLFKVEEHHDLPEAPGEVLAGDITYLKLGDSYLYLAVVIDVYTRAVVGWAMRPSLKTEIVLSALEGAMAKVGPDAQVIFHSDRGSQYASEAYRKFCGSRGVLPSMSRRGNCYDNAYIESWFASLKKEWIYRSSYKTEEELRALVFNYIEVWYNRRRRHSALGYMSPKQFEENHAA